MIWLAFGAMLLAAILCIAWPMYRREGRVSPGLAGGVTIVVLLSCGLYAFLGVPVRPQQPGSVADMLASLEERLAREPGNLEGWKMLGRSQMQLGNYAEAARAYERAVELESRANPQTLADLGEAVLNATPESITGRAGQLFDSALALAPANPKALFYGGIAALQRGDQALAADRWEALLAQRPPPEIEAILRERVAVWRGGEAGGAAPGPVVEVDVALSPDAVAALAPDTTVFVIARDPDQPSPPIAAVRRKASELPLKIALGDADSMLPGRRLSSFDQFEIVARASLTGQPTEQAGDWYGRQTVSRTDGGGAAAVEVVIGQRVE